MSREDMAKAQAVERLRLESILSLTRMRREYQRASLGLNDAKTVMPEGMLDDIVPNVDASAFTARVLAYATDPATEHAFLRIVRHDYVEIPKTEDNYYSSTEQYKAHRQLVNKLTRQYEEHSKSHMLQRALQPRRRDETEPLLRYHGHLAVFAVYFYLINDPEAFVHLWRTVDAHRIVLRELDKLHPIVLRLHAVTTQKSTGA